MPLIILTGIPSSGKSTRTLQLKQYFENSVKKSVHVISEETIIKSMHQEKNNVFSDSSKEKELRGLIKSEANRLINQESVVIIDAGNYIKGYRYELYCMSKGAGTTQCTVNCAVNPQQAWHWNETRENSYSKEVFDALVMRYEAPDNRCRWDSPLFTVLSQDDMQLDAVFGSLFEKKPPPPNQSTQCAPLSSTNFMFELDKVTKGIVSAIMDAQKLGAEGDIKLPDFKDPVRTDGSKLSAAKLSSLRRQFLAYTKLHPTNDITKIGPLFIQFLNSNLI